MENNSFGNPVSPEGSPRDEIELQLIGYLNSILKEIIHIKDIPEDQADIDRIAHLQALTPEERFDWLMNEAAEGDTESQRTFIENLRKYPSAIRKAAEIIHAGYRIEETEEAYIVHVINDKTGEQHTVPLNEACRIFGIEENLEGYFINDLVEIYSNGGSLSF